MKRTHGTTSRVVYWRQNETQWRYRSMKISKYVYVDSYITKVLQALWWWQINIKIDREQQQQQQQKNKEKHTKEILKKLDIIIQCNMKIVNYLDVSLNLSNWNCKHSTNLITKYYKSIKNQITHLVSLNKSPHRLEN